MQKVSLPDGNLGEAARSHARRWVEEESGSTLVGGGVRVCVCQMGKVSRVGRRSSARSFDLYPIDVPASIDEIPSHLLDPVIGKDSEVEKERKSTFLFFFNSSPQSGPSWASMPLLPFTCLYGVHADMVMRGLLDGLPPTRNTVNQIKVLSCEDKESKKKNLSPLASPWRHRQVSFRPSLAWLEALLCVQSTDSSTESL